MKIYIVLVYFSGSEELNINYIKSFKNFEEAENYFNSLSYRCEIIANELIQVKLIITLCGFAQWLKIKPKLLN